MGKTDFSIELALALGTEIISADSRQVYRAMTIGTAKPNDEQLAKVPHHLIGSLSLNEPYSSGIFESSALGILEKIYDSSPYAICTGGAGFYLNVLAEGLDELPGVADSITLSLEQTLQREGMAVLLKELASSDPITYQKIDKKNPRRIIRTLGIIRATSKPYSDFIGKKTRDRPFKTLRYCLTMPREKLYQRIDQRVDQMFESGLVKEVRTLNAYKEARALDTLGYREVFAYLEGEYDLDRCIELVKRNSRRYAKRQLTWFRNQGDWNHINSNDIDLVIKEIRSFI